MNSCEQNQNIDAYLDGELSPSARTQFEQHLALCAICARELARLRRLSATVASYRPTLSADALERIHEAVAQTWDMGIIRLARRISAVAAAVVLAGSLYLTFFQTGQATASVPVWEQTAVTDVQQQPDAVVAGSSSGGEQVQLAEWIVSDLSTAKQSGESNAR
ncbi:MAG TPA: zf-HC2 domain-containing protein [Tepidisphaeraceae bacterium]|jgi:anti-sigma factor RsiW|nr:zf-HC2 domain-containing protein [Tepidisphaeraceae bacterium]